MRVFISLEIPKEIKEEIGKIQNNLKTAGIQARWVKPEIAHLTLAFLGETTPDKISPLGMILENAAKEISPVNLQLEQVSCFPSPAKARIIFLSLGGEIGKLNALASKIRQELKKEKIWFDEKPFVFHLTLARLKNRQNLEKFIPNIKIKKIKFIGQTIALKESRLTPQGPIYKTLKETSLALASKK